jgi:hypothetical protein
MLSVFGETEIKIKIASFEIEEREGEQGEKKMFRGLYY